MGQVELWVGRSGTGKSRAIAGEIAKEVTKTPVGDKVYWIVPETASFVAERLLMEVVPSTIRAEVVTLPRFAERLEREAHLRVGEPINRTGQRLLLAHVLKESAPLLQLLQRARPTISFLDSVLDAFDEMSTHLVSMDGLQAALEIASAKVDDFHTTLDARAGRRLLGKLHDLCALYFLYQRAMRERNLTDPSDRMIRVLPYLSELPSLSGAHIYFDGFRNFEPREMQFVLGLAEAGARGVLAVSADKSWFGQSSQARSGASTVYIQGWDTASLITLLEQAPRPEDVYAPESLRLVKHFMEGCSLQDMSLTIRTFDSVAGTSDKAVSDKRTSAADNPPAGRNPALLHLERQVVSETRSAFTTVDPVDPGNTGMFLFAAQNVRAEADGIARDILSRVHQGDCRFRDILVVVPNLEDYGPYVKDSFFNNGIPLDLADAPSLATHPLAKFILYALLVVEDRVSTTSVIRLLKTEFSGLERDDADWLEGYITRHEVAGLDDWTAEWTYAADRSDRGVDDSRAVSDDRRANRLRGQLVKVLVPLVLAVRAVEITPRTVAEALWTLLNEVRAKRKVASWVVDESNTQNPHEAGVHEQAWQKIMGVLSDLAETMPDNLLSRGFLFQSIREDITSQTLAGVPAGLDAVLVLDIERAAAVHSSVAYVMGVTDGVLPRRIRSTGLLQDDEREQFLRLFGQRLGDTAEERQLAQRWNVYTALTRADQVLVVTHPMAGLDGKELRPSSIIDSLRNCFGTGALQEGWWGEGDVGNPSLTVWTAESALPWLISSLREAYAGDGVRRGSAELLRWLSSQSDASNRLLRAMAGLHHRTYADKLSPGLAAAVYGHPMRMNVYQLETAAGCAYRHFIEYGLRLDEPDATDITAAERGTLIHEALAKFVLQQKENPVEWRLLNDAEAEARMEEIFAVLLEQPTYSMWTKTATRRLQAAEAGAVARRAAIVLTRHLRRSRFIPHQLELSFGTSDMGAFPPYSFELSDGTAVELRGRLDRVDVAEAEGEHRFRIIDYKSRVMNINLGKVFHGLRLQLPVYSSVVKAQSEQIFGRPSAAAGFFYIPLVRKWETENGPLEDQQAMEKAIGRMKVKGLWKGDEVSVDWMDERLREAADSELFPKLYNKNGSFGKNAPVLTEEEWDVMEDAVFDRVKELAEHVHSGDISIAPYVMSRQDTACATCPFASICQIDKRWDTSPLRPLPKLTKDEVLSRWMEKGAQQ